MKHISKVEIVLENCETITIDAKYFVVFKISKVEEEYKRLANIVAKIKKAHCIEFVLHNDANVEYHPFGDWTQKTTVFTRLVKHHDITQLNLFYEGEDEPENIIIDYDEKPGKEMVLGAENINIDTYYNKKGHLFLSICKDKKIEDLFEGYEKEDNFYID